jgi:hypothetical protein
MLTEQAEQPFVGDPQNPSSLLILDGEQAYFYECPTQGDMEHVTNILPNRVKGPDVVAKRSQVPIRGDLSHNLDSHAKPDTQSSDATVTTASGCHTDSSATILEIVSHKPKSPTSATQSPYKTWDSKRSGSEEKLLARDQSAFSDHTASKLKRRRSLNGRGDNDNISSDDGLVVPAAEKAENEGSVKRCKSSLPTSIPLSLTDEFSHIDCDHLRLILTDWLNALLPQCNWSQTEVPAWWPGNVAFQAPAVLSSGGK